jgi:uncharacterized protein
MSIVKHNLKFNIAQLLREMIGAERSYSFSDETIILDETLDLRGVAGKVRFMRTASGVLADAAAQGDVEMECTRCLRPSLQHVTVRFYDEFHSKIEVNTGAPLPKPDEEDPFFIDEAHRVDLGEAIREYTLIELPMRPLCQADCKGLCPQCGIDRNFETCDCDTDVVDERLAALKVLLDK